MDVAITLPPQAIDHNCCVRFLCCSWDGITKYLLVRLYANCVVTLPIDWALIIYSWINRREISFCPVETAVKNKEFVSNRLIESMMGFRPRQGNLRLVFRSFSLMRGLPSTRLK